MIESKSLEVVKKAGFGIGTVFYAKLVFFLSKICLATINNEIIAHSNETELREKIIYVSKFVESIPSGLNHEEAKFFCSDLIKSYFECVYFVISKRFFPIFSNEKTKNLNKLCRQSIREFLSGKTLAEFFTLYSHSTVNVYKTFADQYADFLCRVQAKNNFLVDSFYDYFVDLNSLITA